VPRLPLSAVFHSIFNAYSQKSNGGLFMATINLRDFYPWCKEDIFVEITDEILEAMKAADRQQEAYRRRTYRYKAQYSLDCNDGVENDVLYHVPSPEEIYISEETTLKLFTVVGQLTEIQRRRLIAYYFDGLNFRQIAEMEGVNHGSVAQSVKAALKKLKDFEA
jgi:RNA polymerase sigma factor (sigma-70 family)